MSRRYDDAGVSILKPSVSPTLTLISVANPWMVLLPAPLTPHSLSGVPGLVFSQATGLTIGASHGAAVAGPAGSTTVRPTAASAPARRTTKVLRLGVVRLLSRLKPMFPHPLLLGPRLSRYGARRLTKGVRR